MSYSLSLSPRRRYVFAIHGSPMAWARQRMVRRASATRSGVPRTVPEIVDPEHLLSIFKSLAAYGGPAPGIDGLTYADFSTKEIGAALRQVSLAIQEQRYRPYSTRRVRVPKDAGRTRELRLATVCDRVVAAAVQRSIAPTLEKLYLSCSYGFRRGRSVWHLFADLMTQMEQRQCHVLWTDDVADAFPSILISDAIADYRQVFTDANLVDLIECLLRGDQGAAHTLGVDQGNPLGPDTLNLRCTFVLDRPISAAQDTPLFQRYADNLVYLGNSVSECRRIGEQIANTAAAAGFRLKSLEGPPVDLRRRGARKDLLGFCIEQVNDRPRLSIPQAAWAKLTKSFAETHEARNPTAVASAVASHWLEAYTPALECVDMESVVTKVRQTAAQTGLRELPSVDALVTVAQQAVLRWARLRNTAKTGTTALAIPGMTNMLPALRASTPLPDDMGMRPVDGDVPPTG